MWAAVSKMQSTDLSHVFARRHRCCCLVVVIAAAADYPSPQTSLTELGLVIETALFQ
jgi:hypothetical protein